MRRKYHKLLTPKKIAKNRIKTSAMASRNSLNIWSYQSLSILAIVLLYMITTFAECQHNGLPSISQISPKSSSNPQVDLDSYLSTSHIKLESTILESKADVAVEAPLIHEENETRRHIRVERSAQPILNENFPKSSLNDVQFPNESEKEAAAGRYLHYNIKPTGTYDTLSEYPERTKRVRTGKTLSSSAIVETSTSSSFLLKGDLRQSKSGSPIKPTSSTAIVMETTATAAPHNGRQNPNPDIQDIITGIVKLLNGNVNVHANTQGQRRPAASRINNRGPPRISDVPALPMDYDTQKPVLGTSIRPPPYPFDRPERPFITGVPIPEQIVPFRPGFVSNRPPWHRNKPRPPITTSIGGRRPIQQYKPLPPTPISSQQEKDSEVLQAGQQVPLLPTGQSGHLDDKENPDSAKPTDTTNDSEFSSEDANAHYIEVSDPEPEHGPPETFGLDLEDELLPPPAPAKKDKKPSKNKNVEKKKHSPEEYTTIIETSSVVNTIVHMPSSYLPMPMASEEGAYASTEEVIFMTPSKTSSSESFTSTVEPSQSSNELLLSETLSSSMSTSPLPSFESRGNNDLSDEPKQETTTIPLTSNAPPPSTTIATATTTTTTTSTTIITEPVSNKNVIPTQAPPSSSSSPISTPPAPGSSTEISQYQPRPGIVLDDPEFKPGGRLRPTHPQLSRPPIPQQTPPQVQPTRHHLPPGYGEIFDVTLSAIQGLGSGGGSQQTINIKPYGSYGTGNMGKPPQGDIIISASGEERFVSIDGKRTYINLFGDPTDPPTVSHQATTPATRILQIGGSGSSGGDEGNIGQAIPVSPDIAANLNPVQGVSESEVLSLKPTTTQPKPHNPPTHAAPSRPHYRPRTTQPPVRIDTCIVGDDSTCDQAQHERCKTDNGVSSCHCRPGYSRRKHREPCRKVISFYLGMRVDRIYEHRIIWDNKLLDYNSEPYGQLSYESVRAIDSAMSMTPYSDEFMEAKVNNIYRGDPNLGGSGVFVNMTIKLDESVETLRPNLRTDIHKHLLGVLQRRNNNIGNSVLYVASPEGAVSALHDLDECQSRELNDCHSSAICTNTWGSFRCTCETGFRDPWADQPQRAGRECQSCPDSHCSNRGTCSYNNDGNQVCTCNSSHYGGQCEIDGEVLGVAIGASVAAVIIIVLTLVCLIMWSRRWQREQKNAMGSPVFGYMNTAPLKSAGLPQPGYQVTLEDRMRWAQIADVMAQTNHYGAEPIAPTRPSSALFAYPNLQAMGMGTIGAMSLHSSMQMSQSANMAPPVPLPRRLGLSTRSNGMRTLENSSSSEEEDRTDLLGRNFQVPRPKSRSNGSITNQSGIYYDVDYEPSGNGIGNSSIDHLYGSQNQSSSHSQTHSGNNHIPGPQGIPMSTYTSGRAPSSYYMK